MSQRKVVIAGAGIAGLCAAIDLARQDLSVLVVDPSAEVGGKMRRLPSAAGPVDAGPTVLTMKWVFDALFADAGADFDAHIKLAQLPVLARHAWPDGSRLDLYADHARSRAAIEAFAGPAEANAFDTFSRYTASIYEAVEGPFIQGPKPTAGSLLRTAGLGLLGALRRIDAQRTVWQAIKTTFKDARLRQLFARYATYVGSSPYDAPATLNLIAHVEQQGVWSPVGGMHTLARALERLARSRGVEFAFERSVAAVEITDRLTAVQLSDGARHPASAMVFTGGAPALATLLGQADRPAKRLNRARQDSYSALTWCGSGRFSGFDLAFHTVFFSDDYKAEFSALDQGRLTADPTVYLCAQDRHPAAKPPAGALERFLMLVNAPGHDADAPAQELERCQNATLDRLSRAGLTASEMTWSRTDPATFSALFPGTNGALYGPRMRGWTASLSRPGARTKVPGIYLAGGGAHPGAGVPMAALSGRQAALALAADHPSTALSARGATAGNTSTSWIRRAASG